MRAWKQSSLADSEWLQLSLESSTLEATRVVASTPTLHSLGHSLLQAIGSSPSAATCQPYSIAVGGFIGTGFGTAFH